jgi:hypothetical protein
MYYIIEPDNFDNYGVTRNPPLDDDISFIDGVLLANVPSPLVFEVNYPTAARPPHLLGDTIPVISDVLLRVLRDAGVDNFQAFVAILRNPATHSEWKDYWALNVIGQLDAANMQASTFDIIMEGDAEGVESPLVAFDTLVLDEKKTSNALMFRLTQSPDTLLWHDRVLEHVVAATPTGGWGFDATEVDCV